VGAQFQLSLAVLKTLNQINQNLGGLIAIVGLTLAVVSIGVAIFFYYNPRRPKIRITYKVFFPDYGLARIIRFLKSKGRSDVASYSYFIDIWNSGKEPIADQHIRDRFLLTTVDASQHALIRSCEVDRETHPSISNFRVDRAEEGGVLTWRYFDPGMGVRVHMEITEQLPLQSLAFSGAGLGLELKRVRQLGEYGGAVEFFKVSIVVGVPVLLASWSIGYLLTWFSNLHLSGAVPAVVALPVIVVSAILLAVTVGLGAVVNSGLEALFNLKSPIEKTTGVPSVDPTVASAVSRAYVDHLPPGELHRIVALNEIERREYEIERRQPDIQTLRLSDDS
jgi:hypothetical protein